MWSFMVFIGKSKGDGRMITRLMKGYFLWKPKAK